jgi:hypothetical protein
LISKWERLFKYHYNIPDDLKVEIALINFKGDVIHRFDWLVASHGEPTWDEFVE